MANMAVFATLLYFLVKLGKSLEVTKNIPVISDSYNSIYNQIRELVQHNITHPLAILLLQIITIIFFARTFGFIFTKIGLPSVIGEIFAGLFLGPSFLGQWAPEFTDFIFPLSSLDNLQLLSKLGLVLFMFVIGMELDLKILKNKLNDAIIISHSGIFLSFLLGVFLAYHMYDAYTKEGVSFMSFALFMGTSLSITAFPILARIIHERNLTKTKLGVLVITSAAIDDITGWCILASVIAFVNAGDVTTALFTITLALIFVLIMLKIVQPFFKKLGEIYSNKEALSINVVAAVYGVLLISSFITEIIGIHVLFGAFIAGVIMPPSANFRRIMIEKTESVSLSLLLPLFFVYTGLRTQINLLNDASALQTTLLIILLAIGGKIMGAGLASRFIGQTWKNSLSVGVLMSTRGLMELVVLNIGYDFGILSPEVFTMMIVMILSTTLLSGPMLSLVALMFKNEKDESTSELKKQHFRILLSFANPTSGKKLARISNILSGFSKSSTDITALHVTPNTDINQYQLDEYEKESFKFIKAESKKLGLTIKPVYKVNNNVNDEILNDANSGNYDLLLIGAGQSLFEGTLLGQVIGITASALQPEKLLGSLLGKGSLFKGNKFLDDKNTQFITSSKIPVGLFIDNKLDTIEHVLFIISSVSDVFLFFYAKKVIRNSSVNISFVDYNGIIESNFDIKEEINALRQISSNSVELISKNNWNPAMFDNYNLVIAGLDSYEKISEGLSDSELNHASLLLIRP
jgi:Kef-type K+ transport system membrane component KefB